MNSREVLQYLGASLIEKGVDDFCRAVLAHYGWNAGEPLIIDGIRHAEVVESLRKLVAPLELRVVFLDVQDEDRLKRLTILDARMAEHLELVEGHTTEQQVKDLLPQLADLRLPGDRPVSELVSTLINWIHQGDGPRNACAA